MKQIIKNEYYIAYRRIDNTIKLSSTKTEIANFLSISVDTIRRHLINNTPYITNEYIIWSNVPLYRIERGFALRKRRKY